MAHCFVGVYWEARRQDIESCAYQLQEFLNDIALMDSRLSKWFRKAKSKKSRVEISLGNLAAELRPNLKDIGGEIIPDLGFGFGAWNGSTNSPFTSIRASLGSYNSLVGNSVVINIDGYDAVLRENLPNILISAAKHFDADFGLVTGNEWVDSIGNYSLQDMPAFVRYVKNSNEIATP